MKGILKILLASFTLFSLASCTDNTEKTTNSSTGFKSEPASESSVNSSVETLYTVTFLNYDETVLDAVKVKEGEEAIYSGETPTREEDDEFTYSFKGWDKDLKNITSDVTTTAEYEYTAKENWGSIIWF